MSEQGGNGPIHLVVLRFAETPVPNDLAERLDHLLINGMVRLVDAVQIAKNDNDQVSRVVQDGTQPVAKGMLAQVLFGESGVSDDMVVANQFWPLDDGPDAFGLSNASVNEIVDLIPRGSSAVFVLLEQIWLTDFRAAVHQDQGIVVAHGWVSSRARNLAAEGFASPRP